MKDEDEALKELEILYNQRNLQLLAELAKINGGVKTLPQADGETKEYIILDPQKDWQGWSRETYKKINLTRFVELLISDGLTGFHDFGFCFISVKVPEDFRIYVALHEHEETKQLDIAWRNTLPCSYHFKDKKQRQEYLQSEENWNSQYAHSKACQLEISQVFFKGREFAEKYAFWLLETNGDLEDPTSFFNQAKPEFLKKVKEHLGSPLIVLIRFFVALGSSDFDESPRPYFLESSKKAWPWIEPFLN